MILVAAFFIACFVILGYLLFGPKNTYLKSDKRRSATHYAAWLKRTYPDIPLITAAENRFNQIDASNHKKTQDQAFEMQCAIWVMEGWHDNR